MKILVLGSGIIGAGVVRQLVKYSDAEIVNADIDEAKVKEVAQKYGADRIKAHKLDIDDHAAFVKFIKAENPDVVASTIGPFYHNAGKVYRACIEAGKSCCDVCDDIDGVKQAIALNEEAKKAGVTIISGLGDSPGLTNIIAKFCCDQLDSVDDIHVLWAAPLSEVGLAQFFHGIHCFAFPHQYVNGKLVDLAGKITVEFGEPLGKVDLLYCDHPEPFTLPLYVKGVKNILCAGAAWPEVPGVSLEAIAGFKDMLMEPIKLQGIDVMPIEVFAHMAYRMVQDQMKKWQADGTPYNYGGTIIRVFGLKNGVKTTYTFSGVGKSMTTTPRTLASVAKMVARGEVKVKGAFAAEGCISPLDFMKAFTEGFATIKAVPGPNKNEFLVDIVPV
jgi:saccharopine dehydrogenase (NAD+, L-lysine-forming)